MIDNPKVRAHHLCPFCNGPKDPGCVACWPCFRTCGLKYGDPAAERKLAERERELSGIHTVPISGRPVTVAVAPDNPDATIDATVFLVETWLGEMLDNREIDHPSFNTMRREVHAWATMARSRPATKSS